MAILNITELPQRSYSASDDGSRTYTHVYQVETSSTSDDQRTVVAAVGISRGDPHSITNTLSPDPAAYCFSVSATQSYEDGLVWRVDVVFSSIPPREEERTQSPLLDAPDIQWEWQPEQVIADKNTSGQIILASNKKPYADPLYKSDTRPTLVVTRNEGAFPSTVYLLKDKVNSDSFLGASPGQVLFAGASTRMVVDEIWGTYWQVTYRFEFNPDGWNPQVLEMGYEEYNGPGPSPPAGDEPWQTWTPIYEAGKPITEPVLLDINGKRLPDGGTPVWTTHTIYESAPFAAYLSPV